MSIIKKLQIRNSTPMFNCRKYGVEQHIYQILNLHSTLFWRQTDKYRKQTINLLTSAFCPSRHWVGLHALPNIALQINTLQDSPPDRPMDIEIGPWSDIQVFQFLGRPFLHV